MVPEGLRYTPEHEWIAAPRAMRRSSGSASPTSPRTSSATSCSCSSPTSVRRSPRASRCRGRVDQVGLRDLRPARGEITAVNEALGDTPELVNSDPYGAGWMMEIRLRRRERGRRSSSMPPATRPSSTSPDRSGRACPFSSVRTAVTLTLRPGPRVVLTGAGRALDPATGARYRDPHPATCVTSFRPAPRTGGPGEGPDTTSTDERPDGGAR